MKEFPKKYNPTESEQSWAKKWQQSDLYSFKSGQAREESFVVDTPPPTVSGSLHIGHVFSYTHTDMVTRYKRMKGYNIMYPMGWDDNGLPTERRVQNKFAIRCNPSLSYDDSWSPSEAKAKTKSSEVSRQNFIESCGLVTQEDEKAFEELWRRLGLSVDWDEQYATIDSHCRKISQLSFLDLWNKGFIYQNESPTMWDVDFQTALAQADIEDRESPGAYHDIRFAVDGGESFVISTTRPELLVSCIAVVAHPDDERYQKFFNKTAVTPLFGAKVPIRPSEHADPEKGSGILMVCTFGDAADVDWWKTSGLGIKQSIGKNGRMLELEFGSGPFSSIDSAKAGEFYSDLVGLKVHQARKKVAELLATPGTCPLNVDATSMDCALVGEPKAISHPVKYYEKGDRPIEFITTRQWFVEILKHKQPLLEQGKKIAWHPSHMHTRYHNWVEGLNQDWCISRQRFFGVPFPVWYKVLDSGEVDFSNPLFASVEKLPVDPFTDCPEGYSENQRARPGGFVEDPDVMDTWATSSLTPQLVSNWGLDEKKHGEVFPMDLRPQSHEIIRTWAFYTIAKAWMHSNEIPWKNVVISGWILDPDRKKMSKSKGNVVTPQNLLDDYSSDAVRYWTARARLGVDTAYDESVFKVGRKLSTKLFNASKFVLGFFAEESVSSLSLENVTVAVDRSFLSSLRKTVEEASRSFEKFDYATALSVSEQSFWNFCDNYLELIKIRAYGAEGVSNDDRLSALVALRVGLETYLRLFAPVMPFITEEIWSWYFADTSIFNHHGENNSIHLSSWPEGSDFSGLKETGQETDLLGLAGEVLSQVRTAKSDAQKKLKWPVDNLVVEVGKENLDSVKKLVDDIIRAGNVLNNALELREANEGLDGKLVRTSIILAEEEVQKA